MTSAEQSRRRREKLNDGKPKAEYPRGRVWPGLVPGPLTAQVSRNTFVRRFIDDAFPDLHLIARACNRTLKEQGFIELERVHQHGVVSMLVGTAIDYRIRAYFRRDIYRSAMVERGLFVLQSLEVFQKIIPLENGRYEIEKVDNIWWRRRRERTAGQFIASFKRFVAKIRPERRRLQLREEKRLCRYCILFAYLDFIGRAPFANSAIEIMVTIGAANIDQMLRSVDPAIVADAVELSKIFYDRHEHLLAKFRKVTIGGVLSGSRDVGGADFDMIVDGCLLDFKATRKPNITTNHLRQLIGYWLLDYKDEYKMQSVAFALLRHGHTQYFDIRRDLLRKDRSVTELRLEFRRELRRLRAKQR